MNTAINDANEVLVDCQSVWKIFGGRAPAAVKAISERGLSKTQVLQEFDCVVGVSDASLQVRRGEIFCIMGLSGSGKSTLIRLLNRLIEPSLGKITVKGQGDRQAECGRAPRNARPQYRHGVPERRASSPPDGSRERRLRPRSAGRRQRRAQQDRPRGARKGRACRLDIALSRTSCPAACSSASASPARWRPTPRSS